MASALGVPAWPVVHNQEEMNKCVMKTRNFLTSAATVRIDTARAVANRWFRIGFASPSLWSVRKARIFLTTSRKELMSHESWRRQAGLSHSHLSESYASAQRAMISQLRINYSR